MNQRQFALVLTITFFVGIVWLVFDVLFNTKASIPVSDKLEFLLEPINPNFNPEVLKDIDKIANTNSQNPPVSPGIGNEATEEGGIQP